MATFEFHDKLYKKFHKFFDDAEEKRRWHPVKDVPWDQINKDVPDDFALCAETFLGVESFLPDYIHGGLTVVRASTLAQRWFAANWGYEELKHSMALNEWLLRSGKRTEEQMFDFHSTLMDEEWKVPFNTARQMTIYGTFQEMATFVIYLRHEKLAKEFGDGALATCYRLNARDECAHAKFYESVVQCYLDEDREGTIADIAFVSANFQMPGVGIVPDYDQRVEVMREEGKMDRDFFLKKVYFPTIKHWGITRQELVSVAAARRRAARANKPTTAETPLA